MESPRAVGVHTYDAYILVPLASIALSHIFYDPLVEIWPVKVPSNDVDGLMLAKVSRYFRVVRRDRN